MQLERRPPIWRYLYHLVFIALLVTSMVSFGLVRTLALPWTMSDLLDKPVSNFEDARTMKIYPSMSHFVSRYNRWVAAIRDGLPESLPKGFTQRDRLQRVDDSLACMKEIMETCQVPYFLWGGTLLGAQRFSNHLPWDNDADIALLSGDAIANVVSCLETHSKLKPYYVNRPTPNGTMHWANDHCAVVKVPIWTGIRFVERQTGFTTDAMPGFINTTSGRWTFFDGWRVRVPESVVMPLETNSIKCEMNGRRYSCPHDSRAWTVAEFGVSVDTPPQWVLLSLYATSHYWTVLLLFFATLFTFISGAGVTREIGLMLCLLPIPFLFSGHCHQAFNASTLALSAALLFHALFFRFARFRSSNPAFSPRRPGILAGITLLLILRDLFPLIHNTLFLANLIFSTPLKTDFSNYRFKLGDTYQPIT